MRRREPPRSTARDLERYAGLFAARAGVMRSSAMRDLMAITERPEVISLAGGLPDTSTFPPQSFAAEMTRIAQESVAEALQYGPTEGFDETRLLRACTAHGGYVSKNLRKGNSERFVTVRSYRVGRATAEARFERVLDELRLLGIPLKNRAREYTVFDSAPQIDAGWMA